MIRIFNRNSRKQYPQDIDAMFRLRKRVFHDLLKWDVSVRGDWEIDHYDDANPLYVLSYSDQTGRLRGSLRLLPTLGPNMLDDTFPILLGDNPEVRERLGLGIEPFLHRSGDFAGSRLQPGDDRRCGTDVRRRRTRACPPASATSSQ